MRLAAGIKPEMAQLMLARKRLRYAWRTANDMVGERG
jgi:hypothetical protein